MKHAFLLFAAVLMATSMALAQIGNGTSASAQDQNPEVNSSSANMRTTIRGCLSGSAGNYTLTDQNGMQYQVTGDDQTLRSMVGREVEISGLENQNGAPASQATATSPNGVQASQVRAIASSCNPTGSVGAPPTPNNNGVSPKGTPDTEQPPKPETMAMLLQQQSKPDAGTEPQKTPPVTSQTPATSQPPINPDSEIGKSPANQTDTTPNVANRDAQAARQGEINTNPQTERDSGRGIDNQGVNNPSQTPPNSVPDARDSGVPGSKAQPSNPPQ